RSSTSGSIQAYLSAAAWLIVSLILPFPRTQDLRGSGLPLSNPSGAVKGSSNGRAWRWPGTGRRDRQPGRGGVSTAPPTARRAGLQLGGHRLDLGVGLGHFVAHLAAPAGLLVPAERQRGVKDVVAVDPDRPGAELLGQRMGLGDVAGPDAGAEPVLGVVGGSSDLVQVAERGRDHDRAENLLADDLH